MSLTSTFFSPKDRPYRGPELRSHFCWDVFGIAGDAVVAFVGECRVEIADLVDLEDARNQDPIYSPRMVHFLGEHFGVPLREGVFRQRFLCRLAAELLADHGIAAKVQGDDVYVDQRKATVSVATASPVSVVMHLGVNVETKGVPVPAFGLAEAGVSAQPFAEELLRRYAAEIDDVHHATTKVRGVR